MSATSIPPADGAPAATDLPHDPASPVLRIARPAAQTLPVVVSSPHSGRDYPACFVAQAAVGLETLRSSEDSFVDELFAAAPELGAPMISALFPRVYVDVNRAAYELDPDMFHDELPDYVTTRNARIAAGLGTIARVVANAEPIYAGKLSFAEAEHRIRTCYLPYHEALAQLIEETRQRFGVCILLDCHSMPSGAFGQRRGLVRGGVPDFVLGDCHGISCDRTLMEMVERRLEQRLYRTRRNTPYAGGHVTRHYGRPQDGVHALQIEINRALYMDERRFERKPSLSRIAGDLSELMAGIAPLAERLAAERGGSLGLAAE
jgi:N-formylglutamate amidohydrolase